MIRKPTPLGVGFRTSKHDVVPLAFWSRRARVAPNARSEGTLRRFPHSVIQRQCGASVRLLPGRCRAYPTCVAIRHGTPY
jgi:hypothetical protein